MIDNTQIFNTIAQKTCMLKHFLQVSIILRFIPIKGLDTEAL